MAEMVVFTRRFPSSAGVEDKSWMEESGMVKVTGSTEWLVRSAAMWLDYSPSVIFKIGDRELNVAEWIKDAVSRLASDEYVRELTETRQRADVQVHLNASRCPSCDVTADGRDMDGHLMFGCCLDEWHDTHHMTPEQRVARDRETADLMKGGFKRG
jgi:hypothetical protein